MTLVTPQTDKEEQTPPALFRVITDLVTIKTPSSQTGDAVTVLEIETPPGGGIPPHVQRYEDEVVYVLEGTYWMLIDGLQEDLRPGQSRFISRGTRHAYANPGSTPARMLVYLSPGGIHEQFIAQIGDAPERPIWNSDLARIVALAPSFGIEFESDEASLEVPSL